MEELVLLYYVCVADFIYEKWVVNYSSGFFIKKGHFCA